MPASCSQTEAIGGGGGAEGHRREGEWKEWEMKEKHCALQCRRRVQCV